MTTTVASTSNASLAATLWPAGSHPILRTVLLAVGGSLVLTASAKLQVPFWPVPITLQTLAIQMLAMGLGARLGLAAMLLYLAEGALGMPVFAGSPERGIGLAYMVGPTGGYLVGFVLATVLMGFLGDRGWSRSMPKAMLAGALGTAVILAFGTAWVGVLLGWDKALAGGLVPFLWASFVKVSLAGMLLPLGWRLIRR